MNRQTCNELVADLLRYRKRASDLQQAQVDRIHGFVGSCDAPWRRTTLQGHLTASAWIVDDANERAILVHHKKLNKWLQPGGHIDDADESVEGAALREAREETGLAQLEIVRADDVAIYDVDVHAIPARGDEPAHFHYDIRFRFVSPNDRMTLNRDESNALQWFKQRDIAADTTLDLSVRRMAAIGLDMSKARHVADDQPAKRRC
jgi:8-oxo-dGTP pyrophosphatase MutT (NUDIX family)